MDSLATDIFKKMKGGIRAAAHPATGALSAARGLGAVSFGGMLGKELAKGLGAVSGKTSENSAQKKQAEEAASGLVANALILPMLKQLRRTTWGGEGVFSGGIGEKTFGPQFDMELADRIAQSPRLGIKQALTERIMKRTASGKKLGLDVHG